MKKFAKRFALVFALWTVAAFCGAGSDYLFDHVVGRPGTFWNLLRRPLTEQWIWAALTPLVFLLAHHFPLARPHLWRAIGVHVAAFLGLSVLHCTLAAVVGGPMAVASVRFTGSPLLLRFLEEFYSDIWMYWPLVCIQALIDSHQRVRERERRTVELEASLAKSRLAFLRAQIQPHFLFNTLHALSALIRVDPLAAEDMVADLAQILRAAAADPALQETPLRRELELVDCYLRIQQRRFGERLRVKRSIECALLEAAVPALVLQSLVENAVIHGVAPLDRPGTLEIRAFRDGDCLVVEVEDDGVGMRKPSSEGVGLANARRRLQELYGALQSLELRSSPGQGVAISVRIPLREFDEHTNADSRRRSARAAEPVVPAGA
jgi:two-component system, LytTR family, sensor kinase